jgi:hypothetical protein
MKAINFKLLYVASNINRWVLKNLSVPISVEKSVPNIWGSSYNSGLEKAIID